MQLKDLLNPLNIPNGDEPMKLTSQGYFNTPLHFLYYHVYAANDEQKELVMNTPDVNCLILTGLHLQPFSCSIEEVEKYVRTIITYLYVAYRPFLSTEQSEIPNYKIPNDKHLTKIYNKCVQDIL